MSAEWFIGDLHLLPGAAPALERLTAAIPSGDRLWILGDLFEFWAGRGHAALPDYRGALEAMKAAAGRGVSIRFLPGNRDFLFDERTQRAWGLEPAGGTELLLEAQGRRIYLAHGDFLCPNDWAYRTAAACLRNPVSLALLHALPFPVAYSMAERYRRHSEAKRGKPTAPGTYDLSENMLAGIAGRMKADDLVIGHVHKPVDRPVAGSKATLHILDPWHGKGAPYLRLEDGTFKRDEVRIP